MGDIDVTTIEPLSHAEAMALQAVELERTVSLLRSLEPGDWGAQTDCPDWDVRQMYLHVLGACEAGARMRENVHQLTTARREHKRRGGPLEAAISGVQVRERADTTPEQLRSALLDAGRRGVRARRRLPGLLRALPIPFGPPLGTRPLGYLTDRIYTRDAWMHRIDIARATGRALVLTAAHDGRIVADVVAEWARAHRQPHRLTLTGPAGGTWSAGVGGEELALDAVEFCRTVSGRATGAGLLAHPVPF